MASELQTDRINPSPFTRDYRVCGSYKEALIIFWVNLLRKVCKTKGKNYFETFIINKIIKLIKII
jgi:hypothetical protein